MHFFFEPYLAKTVFAINYNAFRIFSTCLNATYCLTALKSALVATHSSRLRAVHRGVQGPKKWMQPCSGSAVQARHIFSLISFLM